ncbi:hypothetical protein [Desulfosarcina alkanivorans]|nr:hypothetical protein [Desulfosarcina alkanivorans]
MKTIIPFILWLLLFIGNDIAVNPVSATDSVAYPVIKLTVNNQPLGEVLAAITTETGYEFNINEQWESHPVSATLDNLSLEQGLKRLLRNLNHTIIWDSDQIISIMVYGKTEATSHHSGISHAALPPGIPSVPPSEAEDLGELQDDLSPEEEASEADKREMAGSEENAPLDDQKPDKTPIQD